MTPSDLYIITMKRNTLTQAQRSQLSLPQNLQDILVGLILGDLCIRKRKASVNVRLQFEQGLVHEKYLEHLYDLFKTYCPSLPKTTNRPPHKVTCKIYTRVAFNTFSLPCFNYYYDLFYPNGQKVVPLNIGELLTPLSLVYWLCDDGSFQKRDRALVLSTQSFTLAEVKLLVSVLTDKFGLKCTINKSNGDFTIRISSKSIPVLQSLLKDIMPSMMLYKIGL
jgi:hypothetical protein